MYFHINFTVIRYLPEKTVFFAGITLSPLKFVFIIFIFKNSVFKINNSVKGKLVEDRKERGERKDDGKAEWEGRGRS